MSENNIKLRRNRVIEDGFVILTAIGVVIVLLVYMAFRQQLPWFLAIGLALYLGIGLPRWLEFEKKWDLARVAKQKEFGKWQFYGRDREGPWINYVQHSVVKHADCARGKYFYSEWLIIQDGLIIVNPGESRLDENKEKVSYLYDQKKVYAWDGCTPKRMFYWIALLGVPDWRRHEEEIATLDALGQTDPKRRTMFWPKAHYASLVHDALYQYIDWIPISKKNVDILFHDMLLDSNLPKFVATLYYLAVSLFGAWDVKDRNNGQANTTIQCTNPPR